MTKSWREEAYAVLGAVRDSMSPEEVQLVQNFLDGKYAKPEIPDLTEFIEPLANRVGLLQERKDVLMIMGGTNQLQEFAQLLVEEVLKRHQTKIFISNGKDELLNCRDDYNYLTTVVPDVDNVHAWLRTRASCLTAASAKAIDLPQLVKEVVLEIGYVEAQAAHIAKKVSERVVELKQG